jgi:hypothetical protein
MKILVWRDWPPYSHGGHDRQGCWECKRGEVHPFAEVEALEADDPRTNPSSFHAYSPLSDKEKGRVFVGDRKMSDGSVDSKKKGGPYEI